MPRRQCNNIETMKKAIAGILTTLGFLGLVIVIRLYQLEINRLDASSLEGFARWMLMAFGFATAIAPIPVFSQLKQLTRWGCVKTYFKVMGGILGIALGFGVVVLGIRFLFYVPFWVGQPWLMVLLLAVFVPAIPAGIDLLQGTYDRTWEKFHLAHALYLTQALGMLFIQFFVLGGTIAILVGCVLQVIGGLDLIFRFGDRLLLCEWSSAPSWFCLPGQVLFHLGHLVATLIGVKYGDWIFDQLVDRYEALMSLIHQRLKS